MVYGIFFVVSECWEYIVGICCYLVGELYLFVMK